MREKTKNALWRIVPTAVLLIFIAVITGVCFAPKLRDGHRIATATAGSIDESAMVALNNAQSYVAANDFSTELDGYIKAKVFGIKYTQSVSGGREVNGDGFTDTAESKSALVKAGIKRAANGDDYTVSTADYKKKRFVYAAPRHMTREQYVATFGKPATGLVKYELGSAIISATDNGDGSYTFELDPQRATEFCAAEVKHTLGGKAPKYYTVGFTLYTEGGKPVRVTANEQFEIDKFGGTFCTAQYTEVFKFD